MNFKHSYYSTLSPSYKNLTSGRRFFAADPLEALTGVGEYMALRPGMSLLWNTGSSPRSCTVTVVQKRKRKGARAMLGFAATFSTPRTTEERMKELREGEEE